MAHLRAPALSTQEICEMWNGGQFMGCHGGLLDGKGEDRSHIYDGTGKGMSLQKENITFLLE
jgi:hypothetical protein